MVDGPAVTLGDDHAPAVRIDALETFVDLLARVEDDALVATTFYAPPVRGDVPAGRRWTAR